MTDNEIIKALVIHADNEADCSGCPIYLSDTGETCACELSQNALDLINRQKAEIERLEREIEDLESTQEITPEAKHFIDTKADKVISLMNEIIKSQDQIKSEAITKFAERLKEKMNDVARWSFHGDDNEYFIIGKPFIDQIAKEMRGEQ